MCCARRVNYIRWLHALLRVALPGCERQRGASVLGLDIGTGASCIYPLLGTALYGWHFVATDINADSLRAAEHNVALNGWQDRIALRHVSPDALLSGALAGVEREVAFSMCNPPFFDVDDEVGARIVQRIGRPLMPSTARRCRCAHVQRSAAVRKGGGRRRDRVCEAHDHRQLRSEGPGTCSHAMRALLHRESLAGQVRWFTTMLGRRASVKPLVRHLRQLGGVLVRTTEFLQGRTTRWGLAWSFHSGADGGAPQVRRACARAKPARLAHGAHSTQPPLP